MNVTLFFNHDWYAPSVRWMQDSIISQAINFSRCSRCWRNSASGQCKSRMNDWRASNFQNRSSDVAQPLLWANSRKVRSVIYEWSKLSFTLYSPISPSQNLYESIVRWTIPLNQRNERLMEQMYREDVDEIFHSLDCLQKKLLFFKELVQFIHKAHTICS